MSRLTVKTLARIAGVSVRTLHHYDAIGLLKPASIGRNGYRYYGEEEMLRLQQILIHRELGMPLAEIGRVLDAAGFDRLAALREQRARLAAEAERYARLVVTIDRTIARLNGDRKMKNAELYEGISPEKQSEYEQWLVDRYGEGLVGEIEAGRKRAAELGPEQVAERLAALHDIEQALAEAHRRGIPAGAPVLDPLLARHRAWVGEMWGAPCAPDAYTGLADLYLAHPDFVARYETIAEGFARFLSTSMKLYARRLG
jgi:MerR family transcriptional regulator, thiopeptide resistance regulator